ncbi:DEAD/DEAH box helicase [Thermofilum pendens]|uniref:Type III restriction enzyme, res subunit n=1 Tax=Thermofilum pendens (strain DSM 2475 / Hrk 5) TaxID=368408 RepID=A1RXX4_THEPD|nr:DEAD/DEAH box helicase [Thermofilum pendens]ABL78054.1 type III restriction enzyme, res subunit [Thermofilum pendens Hrk 5]
MMTDYGGLNDSYLSISFRKRRTLTEAEFREFLELARKVANYDPESKEWRISVEKVSSLDNELEEVLEKLKKLSTLSDADLQRVVAYTRGRSAGRVCWIGYDLRVKGLPPTVVEALRNDTTLGGLFLVEGQTPRLRSVLFLHEASRALKEKFNVSLSFDEKMTSVEVRRENGVLVWRFQYLDKVLAEKLVEASTLKFFVEKAVLNEEGEFEGTELVERRMRTAHVDWQRKEVSTPVALLDSLKTFLEAHGFRVLVSIEEKPPITVPLEHNFKLLPHQVEAYKQWTRKRRGTISIFTRGGKSFIALEAIYSLRKPTIVFVTTQELVETWISYFEKYLGLPRSFVGVLGGGEQKIREITVATYSSAVKYIDLIKSRFELAIFDEAHHVPAATFKQVALGVDALYRMALSATPERRDRNEGLLFTLCGGLLYRLTYEDLVRLKVVAPIEVLDAVFVEGPEEKKKKLLEILRRHADGKVIVYTQYLQTAEDVYDLLRRNGFNAEIVTGDTPAHKRELAFKNFVEGRSNVIVTTTVLDEGITVPDADVAVIYEGTGEGRQMIQRIGRVLGYYPGKTAKVYEIVDLTNPREKSAYRRRSWVRELYRVRGLEEIVRRVKEGDEEGYKPSYQFRIDYFD